MANSGDKAVHLLEFDGYAVGDRLLEGVIFLVEVEQAGNTLTVGEVRPRSDAESYLSNIRWKNFVPDILEQVKSNIEHLESLGVNFEEEFDSWTEESGQPGVQVLVEV